VEHKCWANEHRCFSCVVMNLVPERARWSYIRVPCKDADQYDVEEGKVVNPNET
jgi:hypothetical protein